MTKSQGLQEAISNCCKAEMKVVGGDEGTMFYQCLNCGKGCDPCIQEPEQIKGWGKSEIRVKAEVLAGLIREELDLEEAIQTIELNLAQAKEEGRREVIVKRAAQGSNEAQQQTVKEYEAYQKGRREAVSKFRNFMFSGGSPDRQSLIEFLDKLEK